MSEKNVEILRQQYEAFDRRDRVEWLALRDEDCEVVTDRYWPEAGLISGDIAAWEFYTGIFEAFDQAPVGIPELVDAGTDKVLAHLRHEARGSASGADVEVNYWVVVTFRSGRTVRDEWFADRTEALEAAGLA